MKSVEFLMVAAAVAVSVCAACGVEPVSSGGDGSVAAADAKDGAAPGDLSGADVDALQDNGQGADVAADVKADADTPKDATVETADVTCPPEGKPERTVEFSAKDGPTCGTFLEKKFAEVVGGGKEWYAVSCKTFGNPNNCSAMTEVYSFKYVPETWTDAPKEQLTAYAGSSYVGVTMPNNKKAPITEYALVSCDENECVAVTPKPAYKDWYGELRYSFKTKLLSIIWDYPGDGPPAPMIFKLVQ